MTRHIIIGDIHGCFTELLELLDRVHCTEEDIVVSVGDLVDRGPDSPRVLAWFRERKDRGKAIVLMGNHERKHVREVFSYGQEITRLQFGEGYKEAVAWMRGLPYFYETDDFIVVHAAVNPELPLAEQRDDVLAGTTSGERTLEALPDRWHALYRGPKPVVFGHHVTGRDPLIASHAYGLDTGACHGGRLTALVVPGFELVSVDAHADYWEIEKKKWQEPVLLSRPWMEMSFAKANRELERWREDRTPLIDAIATWLSALESLLPTLQSKLVERAAQIPADAFNQEVEKLPYKALLHLAKRGRLDPAAVAERCVNPRRTIELATALGVELPTSPMG